MNRRELLRFLIVAPIALPFATDVASAAASQAITGSALLTSEGFMTAGVAAGEYLVPQDFVEEVCQRVFAPDEILKIENFVRGDDPEILKIEEQMLADDLFAEIESPNTEPTETRS